MILFLKFWGLIFYFLCLSIQTIAADHPTQIFTNEIKLKDFVRSRIELLHNHSGGDQSGRDEVFIYTPTVEEITCPLFICGGMGPEAGLLAWLRAVKMFPSRTVILDQRCSTPDRTRAIQEGPTSLISQRVVIKIRESFLLLVPFLIKESGLMFLFHVIQLIILLTQRWNSFLVK